MLFLVRLSELLSHVDDLCKILYRGAPIDVHGQELDQSELSNSSCTDQHTELAWEKSMADARLRKGYTDQGFARNGGQQYTSPRWVWYRVPSLGSFMIYPTRSRVIVRGVGTSGSGIWALPHSHIIPDSPPEV